MLQKVGSVMWHGVLAVTVGNKPFLAAWLMTLSLALGAVGDKVFVQRTEELTVLKLKLEQIQATLEKIDSTTTDTNRDVVVLMIEQARMKQELLMHMEATSATAAKR